MLGSLLFDIVLATPRRGLAVSCAAAEVFSFLGPQKGPPMSAAWDEMGIQSQWTKCKPITKYMGLSENIGLIFPMK